MIIFEIFWYIQPLSPTSRHIKLWIFYFIRSEINSYLQMKLNNL